MTPVAHEYASNQKLRFEIKDSNQEFISVIFIKASAASRYRPWLKRVHANSNINYSEVTLVNR